ncbi:hypothetical protein BCR33DRAFT_782973 [Rhizoclosmatium globosum]|uniref:PR-1-like protein n=1 Tax=Rhizoclosmatium globosum TaxID=329046 RepID=A0A1Y2CLN5_9FUNG|nr:hypothetical protein BCR33DRAFT_782973 [Rhizoclosmatium globosum]|eukprot:ORY47920.1 hypothetical protein BCR33DRAFT_782973 [Rhizoclosmatium globosum]
MQLFKVFATVAAVAASAVVAQITGSTADQCAHYAGSVFDGTYCWFLDSNNQYWYLSGTTWTPYNDGSQGSSQVSTSDASSQQSQDANPRQDSTGTWIYYDQFNQPAYTWDGSNWQHIDQGSSQQVQQQTQQQAQQNPRQDATGTWIYYGDDGQPIYTWDGSNWQPINAQQQQQQQQAQQNPRQDDSGTWIYYGDDGQPLYVWDGAAWQTYQAGPAPAPQSENVIQGSNFAAADQVVVGVSPCSKSNLAACQNLAYGDFQNADDARAFAVANGGTDFASECQVLHTHARQYYSGLGPLKWNSKLAAWAQVSAAYADATGYWEAHSYSADIGLFLGQNLYVGKATCAEAYYGWVTEEALGTGPSGNGHFLNQAGLVFGGLGDYSSVGCGAYGNTIVCNLGLDDALVNASLDGLKDINVAFAEALKGEYNP